MSDLHPLRKMVIDLQRRDAEDVKARTRCLEDGVDLANNRAMDALFAIGILADYIVKKEEEQRASQGATR